MLSFSVANAGVSSGQTGGQSEPTTAKEVVERLFKRYANANSLNGQIKMTISASGQTSGIVTNVAFLKPSLLRISQTGPLIREKVIRSNGNTLVYSVPENMPTETLSEPVFQRGVGKDVREMYQIGRSGLKDKGPVLDLLFADPRDLRFFLNQLATVEFAGTEQVQEQMGYVVKGQHRDSRFDSPSGTYKLVVASNGDLLRYSTAETIVVMDPQNKSRVLTKTDVYSTWDVAVKINTPIEDSVFSFN